MEIEGGFYWKKQLADDEMLLIERAGTGARVHYFVRGKLRTFTLKFPEYYPKFTVGLTRNGLAVLTAVSHGCPSGLRGCYHLLLYDNEIDLSTKVVVPRFQWLLYLAGGLFAYITYRVARVI